MGKAYKCDNCGELFENCYTYFFQILNDISISLDLTISDISRCNATAHICDDCAILILTTVIKRIREVSK